MMARTGNIKIDFWDHSGVAPRLAVYELTLGSIPAGLAKIPVYHLNVKTPVGVDAGTNLLDWNQVSDVWVSARNPTLI